MTQLYCKAPFCENIRNRHHSWCATHRWEREKRNIKAYKELLPFWAIKKCEVHGYLKRHQVYLRPKNNYASCIVCDKERRPVYDKEAGRRYNKKHSDRRKDKRLQKRYKISLDDYNILLNSQNFKCAICSIHILDHQKLKGEKKQFAVDHCHKSNKIRGLLCYRCNMGLGYFQDDAELTQSATNYLSIFRQQE